MDGGGGRESGAKEGFAGANSPCGKTTGNRRGWGCAASAARRIPGLGRRKGKVRKMSHQGERLENSTFPPKFPSTAAAAGSDVEGKDRNKEKGKAVTESAGDALGRLQPGAASPTRRKWIGGKIKGRSRSILSPGTPGIPGPAQHLGLGLD